MKRGAVFFLRMIFVLCVCLSTATLGAIITGQAHALALLALPCYISIGFVCGMLAASLDEKTS